TTRLIGRRCTHGNVFSRPVLIGRGLDRTLFQMTFVLAMKFSGSCRDRQINPVAMAAGPHPFPFRTRQLSPPAPLALGGRSPRRVGRRRVFSEGPPALYGAGVLAFGRSSQDRHRYRALLLSRSTTGLP